MFSLNIKKIKNDGVMVFKTKKMKSEKSNRVMIIVTRLLRRDIYKGFLYFVFIFLIYFD